MTMMNTTHAKVAKAVLSAAGLALTAALLTSCATAPTAQQVDEATQQVLKSSFSEQGIAKMDRLTLDASNQACSEAAGKPLDEKLAKSIEEANLKTVKLPSDGKYLGSWAKAKKSRKTAGA
jgi:sulfur-oxidizing protein SoxX